MKLWLLRPVGYQGNNDPYGERGLPAPWVPWFDTAQGFVIRARTEEEARRLASEHHGSEGAAPWNDPNLSTCEPLSASGKAGIVVRDFAAA